ncbi:Hypothetical protein FKW44_022121 [Caligus rogercresseyi]|uniref:Uncharacterized protein n=1 Tax=Caligus rogercresseyi TaxID=217165 RepID=A0A7T8GSF4_CALRO|nr:Hypothetical protein FKW44_022121 [Caligus rogercresseyi]
MELMSTRFEDMRRKLEMTHETLAHTKVRIESHELLKSKVQKLKSLANSLSEKQRQRLLPSESENKVLKEYVKPTTGRPLRAWRKCWSLMGNLQQ